MLTVTVTHKAYPHATHPALTDLHLSVADGEFVALVGPSGCGKSTLLNIISGLDKNATFSLQLDKQHLTVQQRFPLNMGFMFQESRLMPWLTVLDNLLLVLDKSKQSREQALHYLAAVGLADHAQQFPAQLSGGMQRRVALARAFVVQPRLLLMDEPFISVDAPTAERLRSVLLALWETSRPMVLFVTHDLREALSLADRVLFLSASPARVILEQTINLARPREMQMDALQTIYNQLLTTHPDLLSGICR
ncbi:ABC transporter ATP-binding protein [Beggiatoa leptomitoformis]|uniref:ATP-binding cassette domain-containing protein n=1 Tax=Beggiatoa leptomitoformis TaxID=288004 RepID=A0A2N9YAV1_9GAMM|nr:ABC transporter ATP-binding protein [Beggiatoa leptomitoformis]ALG67047.1 ATP-binding cassette domain-containing protein [Beggiatoa leptomitoformis]AUI67572.1 ATP-binding cassette domain-containing protein [Beggiatoa leptomitoformis]